ncbi:MAG TPA: hypothetical protein DCX10_01315, partial [Verrucomicrobiales bacterium]|nr:hypothetical protein [Verrucomicrobiales bacterium]
MCLSIMGAWLKMVSCNTLWQKHRSSAAGRLSIGWIWKEQSVALCITADYDGKLEIDMQRIHKRRLWRLYIIFSLVILLSTVCFGQQEALDALVPKIDSGMYTECEKAVRESLDKLIEKNGAYGVYPPKKNKWTGDSLMLDLEEGHLPPAAARF